MITIYSELCNSALPFGSGLLRSEFSLKRVFLKVRIKILAHEVEHSHKVTRYQGKRLFTKE